MVQLRENHAASRDFYDTAKEIKDITASVARKLIGRNKLLGVSASSLCEAVQAQNDGADYLGVGAMFPTRTKHDAKIVSMEEWRAIRQAVTIPIVVIGGITKENAAAFLKTGADDIAVVSAILAQPDIRRAAEELKREVTLSVSASPQSYDQVPVA